MNRAAPRRPDSRPSGPPSPPPPPGEDGEGRSGEDGDDVSPDRRGEVDAMASQTLVLAFFSFSLFFWLASSSPLAGVSRDFDGLVRFLWCAREVGSWGREGADVWRLGGFESSTTRFTFRSS
jgi:hypothetical protein